MLSAGPSRAVLIAVILLAVLLNAGAQLFLRVGARQGLPASAFDLQELAGFFFRPALLGGLLCYAASLLVWIWVLARVEVSFGYPFLGLGFVLVAFGGPLLLGESWDGRKLVASALIVAGVTLLAGSRVP